MGAVSRRSGLRTPSDHPFHLSQPATTLAIVAGEVQGTVLASDPAKVLAVIERAKSDLAAVQDTQEAASFVKRADAILSFIRAAKAGHELQHAAAELALRTKRRAGEFLAEREKSSGGRPVKEQVETSANVAEVSPKPTLNELRMMPEQENGKQRPRGATGANGTRTVSELAQRFSVSEALVTEARALLDRGPDLAVRADAAQFDEFMEDLNDLRSPARDLRFAAGPGIGKIQSVGKSLDAADQVTVTPATAPESRFALSHLAAWATDQNFLLSSHPTAPARPAIAERTSLGMMSVQFHRSPVRRSRVTRGGSSGSTSSVMYWYSHSRRCPGACPPRLGV